VAAPTPRVLRAVAVIACLPLVVACSFGPPTDSDGGGPPRLPTPTATAAPEDTGPPSVVATVLAEGLRVPWAVAFLPDGTALTTERDTRRIVALSPGTGTGRMRKRTVQTVRQAVPRGEGGLLGLAVSPEYERDETVFIYYTTDTDNRIAKLKLGGTPRPIVTGIPAAGIHNGGRLRFGPDGYLYATTGDAALGGRTAQNRKNLGGKILRMTVDGKPAPGNPDSKSLVWSYGHRNVQGLAWSARDQLYATEFGQNTWDEVNLIRSGANYGWPEVEGIAEDDRYVDPVQQWSTREASCSGTAMSGDVLVTSCLRGQRLWLIRLTATGTVLGAPVAALVGEYGRLREAVVAPDGSVWVTTSNHDGRARPRDGDDKIIRIVVANAGGVSET
jgi:glucose/arabinose dehydrogenase